MLKDLMDSLILPLKIVEMEWQNVPVKNAVSKHRRVEV
jgi:hypothetical protein